MANGSGTCYTWSGDKKIYEPGLFKADIEVCRTEYCFRYDSVDSKTLVFGKFTVETDGSDIDHFTSYLPCCGLSINHNIQANGEDHYSLSGTYIKPGNWSPPAGVDGPFDAAYYLKCPYYVYIRQKSYYILARYGDIKKTIKQVIDLNGDVKYYGNKK